MEQQDKNKWVDEVMRSLDGSTSAEPNAFLFGKIENRLSKPVMKARVVSLRTVSLAAACILLLVLLNVLLLSKQQKNTDKSMQEIASYYELTNTNPLYSL